MERLSSCVRDEAICTWKLREKLSVMLNFFRRQKPVKLGRWQTTDKKELIDRKIDLNNCDSCGTCGQTKKNLKIKFLIVEGDVVHNCHLFKN